MLQTRRKGKARYESEKEKKRKLKEREVRKEEQERWEKKAQQDQPDRPQPSLRNKYEGRERYNRDRERSNASQRRLPARTRCKKRAGKRPRRNAQNYASQNAVPNRIMKPPQ
jgi:hypothetical protein